MHRRAKLAILFLSTLVVLYGLLGGVLNQVSARDEAFRNISVFTDVLNRIREEYVEEPDMEKAMQGALHGMMEALDPYASFVEAEVFARLKDRSGLEGTPGIVLSKRYGYGYVVAVQPGSSAEQAGLRTGDLVESIEGRLLTQMSLWEARRLLLGEPGSEVVVRVIRARRSEPYEIRLQREKIEPGHLTVRILEEGIGVMRISHFHRRVSEEIEAKVKFLRASGLKGLVVDVRGCAEGEIEEGIKASDLFLLPGLKIVTVRDREGNEQEFLSQREPILSDTTLMLLADGGTSGAAEVFAGALKDHEVAEVVGERTNGDGAERSLVTLDSGTVLMISTRLFVRPSGEPIQQRDLRDSGIKPDVRSPDQSFVSQFYFENTGEEEMETQLDDVFFRRLDEAIAERQLETAVKELKDRIEEIDLEEEAA